MAVSAIAVEPRVRGVGRLPALGGAGFVVLVVAAFTALGGNTPGSNATAAKLNAFYDANQTREIIASFVVAASAPLLVAFAASLAQALRPADGVGRSLWHPVLAAGSAIAGGAFIVTALLHFALTDAAGQSHVSGAALQTLNMLDADSWVAFNSGLGVMMLGAGGLLLARKAYPALAWIALVAGIALFIPFADFFALMVSGLWIIVTSVLLFRRGPAFAAAR